jgi:hypothetical protein
MFNNQLYLVGFLLARARDRLHSTLRAQGRMAAPLQQIVEELHVQLVILYNEDGFGHGG